MSRLFTRCKTYRYLWTSLAIGAILATSVTRAKADWRTDIGYDQLADLLGDSLPNGSGVPISLVEAQVAGTTRYFPDVTLSDFDANFDPLSVAVSFIDGSGGQSNGNSNHASDQARFFFGNTTSVAPLANEVTVYEANDWLTDILNLSGNSTPPDVQDFRVQNFSWIGTFATPNDGTPDPTTSEINNDRKALAKLDFAIERDNITAVVGVHNVVSPLPNLLSHSYNSIAVGRSSGQHSTGYTRFDRYGIGRSKPDIVAPQPSTSAATSSVSSVATFLHSAETVLGTDAVNSETMKAILLAGARKDTLGSWSQIDSEGEWHPLDDTFGAGEVNIYNSFAIVEAGQNSGTLGTPTTVSAHGWDYQTVQPGAGNEILYDFVVPTGMTATELSIVATWNAEINAPFQTGDPVLADLDLELVDALGTTVDTDLGDSHVDGLSASEVDNVEHIYLTDLSPGTYTLKVSSDSLSTDYGLAWRTATAFDILSADFDEDGDIDGIDFLTWQSGFGQIVGATRADGDTNGDGDVDQDDLTFLQTELLSANPALAVSLFGIPEPTGIALASAAFILLSAGRLRIAKSNVGRS